MSLFDASRVKVIGNVLEIRILTTDTNAHAVLDSACTCKPNGNVRYFLDNEIIIECLSFNHPHSS